LHDLSLDFPRAVSYGHCAVRKLPEVEEAKSLMSEAMEWSMFTWLFQKSRVREVADRANAALDGLNAKVKSRWSPEVKVAYKDTTRKTSHRANEPSARATDPEVESFVKKVKHADDAARRARIDAEETFDEAERQMNTSLAREGCKKAIHQWELDEKAIRQAEAVPDSLRTTP